MFPKAEKTVTSVYILEWSIIQNEVYADIIMHVLDASMHGYKH